MRVNKIEENELVISYLDAHVTSDIVQEATDVIDGMVAYPSVIFELIVPLLLKEKDLWWAPSDKSFIKEKLHLAKIKFSNSLKPVLVDSVCPHGEYMPLTIEYITLIFRLTIEALVRKIFLIDIHEILNRFIWKLFTINVILFLANQHTILYIPHEVIVIIWAIVEKCDKNLWFAHKAACDEGVMKFLNECGIVRKAKHLSNFNLWWIDLFDRSRSLPKYSHPELSIVLVWYCKHLSCRVLSYFLKFDIGLLFSSEFFIEYSFASNNIVLRYIALKLILILYWYSPLGVKGYKHGDNRMFRNNRLCFH